MGSGESKIKVIKKTKKQTTHLPVKKKCTTEQERKNKAAFALILKKNWQLRERSAHLTQMR